MRIAELFRRPIDRRIEDVTKVDLNEESTVALEIDEYVVTEHIRDGFEVVLNRYQETILNPDEGTPIWISGFFGSGKSSFAKILGYLLANPEIMGRTATERFKERVDEPRIEALLNTIHAQAPTHAVFVDLATGRNVVREGESIVLPLYRALLESLGYSRNILLADLEWDLEGDGQLAAFEEAFAALPESRGTWTERRNVGLARGEASQAMHLLRPATYPQADSWSRSAAEPPVTANWFADRAVAMLKRRGDGAERLVFIVDEVGQYVSRSVQRMLDLQGLAEAVQKTRGKLWLAVTSQERLADVVDSLEGKQIELARVQARFPVRVDLLPEDIDEVAGKRVLEKSDAGQQAVRRAFRPHRNQLASHVRLDSPTRADDLAEDGFVRLYPMLPYQIQLLIDAVSARRAQVGGGPMLGGGVRTLIKLAQQLVAHPKVGVGADDVGTLVTIDRAYDLLEAIIPTAWRAEIHKVAERCGANSLETRVAKTVALCVDVPALNLNAPNLAVLLHPAIGAESLRSDVTTALDRLERDDVLLRGENGYRLQSPEEKAWEKTRRGIEMKPSDAVRIRRQVLRGALTGLSVTAGRTFRVQVNVEGEKVLDGDVTLVIEEADEHRRSDVRSRSREIASDSTIWWCYDLSADAYQEIEELHRSQQMIARKDAAAKSAGELELLGEERNRQNRHEQQVARRLAADLLAGQVIFRGEVDDPAAGDLRVVSRSVVADRLERIYSRLDEFSAPVTKKDVMAILRSDDLRGLPDYLGENGIGLTKLNPEGVSLATDTGPLATVLGEITSRASYGNEATGRHLERKFGTPPYGAPVEVVQALVAAGIRAGLVEAVHQGARIARADDARLDRAFGTLPAFRASSFVPQIVDVPIEVRTSLGKKLGELTGSKPSPAVGALAEVVRETFLPDADECQRVDAALRALGLPVPSSVTRTAEILGRIRGASDSDTVRTAHDTWADLEEGRRRTHQLAAVIDSDLAVLRDAVAEMNRSSFGLGPESQEDREQLSDLLKSGDFAEHLGQVKSIVARLREERAAVGEALRLELVASIEANEAEIRGRYSGDVDDTVVLEEALSVLTELCPPDGDAMPSLELLAARRDAVPGRAAQVSKLLEDKIVSPDVVRIDVSGIVPAPIATEEDLEAALESISEAVSERLAQERQVRLV